MMLYGHLNLSCSLKYQKLSVNNYFSFIYDTNRYLDIKKLYMQYDGYTHVPFC